MPWINGEYKLSLYCKEELPTWDEMYNEFYLGKISNFYPDDPDHQKMDLYWKRPRRKILLAFGCNQLNKMIYEDGINPAPFLKDKFGIETDYVRFVLAGNDNTISGTNLGVNVPPPIYNCKVPSTNSPSIFTTSHPRIDIDTITTSTHRAISLSSVECETDRWDSVIHETIKFIIKDMIEYFENGVGWKDDEGKILPSEQLSHNCEGVGYDPAL